MFPMGGRHFIGWRFALIATAAATATAAFAGCVGELGAAGNDGIEGLETPAAPVSTDIDSGFVEGDASSPSAIETSASTPCGEFTTSSKFSCSKDGLSRGKCVASEGQIETCDRGCLRKAANHDDQCMNSSPADWTCPGKLGATKLQSGDYFITSFGGWIDQSGVAHGDTADNCIPTCIDEAKAAGICKPGDSGKACEQRVGWYAADGQRFGCLAHVRVTNPANGKSVVLLALDHGPDCSYENKVSHGIFDTSGLATRFLFGVDKGAEDRAPVHVVEVDKSTPLGPVK
ncbi:MAG: hypothetical protein NVSMB1_06760 [Polyangiales bacterium]